jgi:hypothetical protein
MADTKSTSKIMVASLGAVAGDGHATAAPPNAAPKTTRMTLSDTLRTPITALRKVHFAERELWNIGPRVDR